jgi:putative transposase
LVVDYGAKWPKAVAKVVDDTEALLTFFDYPAEHWLHLRTTNPIESTFSPVRARTRVTKGPGNKDAGLAMVFKLLEAAEGRWRAVNGPHLVALVRAGLDSKGQAGRATQGGARGGDRRGRRVIMRTGDPQDLTIPP